MYNIEDLKKEYIGKEFGWLTVLDVYRENGILYIKCQCKCGNVIIRTKKSILSNRTKIKSCGCYNHSKEKAENYSQWCKNNQEFINNKAKNYSIWCKNNQDKVKQSTEKHKIWNSQHQEELKQQGLNHSKWFRDNPNIANKIYDGYKHWCINNPELVKLKTRKRKTTFDKNPNIQKSIIDKNKTNYIEKRKQYNYDALKQYITEECFAALNNGLLTVEDDIEIKCSVCCKTLTRKLNNVYRLKDGKFRSDSLPLCDVCKVHLLNKTSKPEQEIEDFIKSFYSGECIRNSRNIISPQELDLYYPEKKIAIEYNGSYWHSDEFKEKDYHINKFNLCKDNNILLVSIFESEWNNKKEEIKNYLKDLFNGKENKLSFNEDYSLMNNNYPSPNINIKLSIIQEDYYTFNNHNIFTCGYSIL